LWVQPGDISSETTAPVTSDSTLDAVAGYKASIHIQAKDQFGNIVTEGGATLTGHLWSMESSHKIQLSFKDLEDGVYEGSFPSI